jgi:hypothetical protein
MADVSEWDGPAVLLPLTTFIGGFEARGAHRHVAGDRRRRYQHHWHRYWQEHAALGRPRSRLGKDNTTPLKPHRKVALP